MQIREIMTRNPATVRSNESVMHAAEIMKKLNVGILPVVDQNKPVGIITDRDITLRTIAEHLNPSSTSVGEIMSKEVYACFEDSDASECIRTMENKQVRRMLVRNADGSVSGIVSLRDIAQKLNKETAGEVVYETSR